MTFMKKNKVIIIVLLISFIILMLCICTYDSQLYPEDGVWYCEELQIYIDFGPGQISKAIIDGEEIDCEIHHRSDSLSITIVRLYSESTPENRVLFPGKFISQKGNELILCDRDTKVEYTFVKIEE